MEVADGADAGGNEDGGSGGRIALFGVRLYRWWADPLRGGWLLAVGEGLGHLASQEEAPVYPIGQ